MLWEVEIHPAAGERDQEGQRIVAEAQLLGTQTITSVSSARSYLVEGDLDESTASGPVTRLLGDTVVEDCQVHVLPGHGQRAGRPAAECALQAGGDGQRRRDGPSALADAGLRVERVATCRKYWINADASATDVDRLCAKVLANDAIEQVIRGPLPLESLALGSDYAFELVTVPLREMDDEALMRLSREGQLYLSLAEMQTIRQHFQDLGREPTDIELESIAQTWSEHCSHKTLAGRIAYRDEKGERRFENMLKETIFEATQTVRRQLGADDWCISVFKDNAGVVTFDDENDVCFKVETHNHPSALEPYGGANTGLGGVIRDPLGTGLGARSGLQYGRLLLRSARDAVRHAAARRAASQDRHAGRGLGSAGLRQPDGDSDRQRSGLLR